MVITLICFCSFLLQFDSFFGRLSILFRFDNIKCVINRLTLQIFVDWSPFKHIRLYKTWRSFYLVSNHILVDVLTRCFLTLQVWLLLLQVNQIWIGAIYLWPWWFNRRTAVWTMTEFLLISLYRFILLSIWIILELVYWEHLLFRPNTTCFDLLLVIYWAWSTCTANKNITPGDFWYYKILFLLLWLDRFIRRWSLIVFTLNLLYYFRLAFILQVSNIFVCW